MNTHQRRPFWKAPTFQRGVVLLAALAAVVALMDPSTSLQVANVARLVLAVAVSVAYWSSFFDAVRARVPDAGDHLMIGIQLAWISDAAVGVWVAAFLYSGAPDWWLYHWLLGRLPAVFLTWGICSAVLHITVPSENDQRVPLLHAVLVTGALVLTVVIIAALSWLRQR